MTTALPLNSLDELSSKIGLPKFVLTRYIFQADSYYKTFKLSKKSGRGYRNISAPSKELKGIQKWISIFILRTVELPDCATAFRPGLSIKDNAKEHLGQDFVLNIDLRDFYPSISAKRITAIFKGLGYSPSVAGALSRLTTFRGQLAQGAPSSPDLANIVLRRLDSRISTFCSKADWRYTRYCDDISISGKGFVSRTTLKKIFSIVTSEGFTVNKHKLRTSRNNSRQEVTGLVVNKCLNLPKQKRKAIRAMFHQVFLFPERFTSRIEELEGHLQFYCFIRGTSRKEVEKFKEAIRRVKDISSSLS